MRSGWMRTPAVPVVGVLVAAVLVIAAVSGVAIRAVASGPSTPKPRRQANGLLTGRIHIQGRHVLLSRALRRRGAVRRTGEPPDVLSRKSVVTDNGSEPGPSDLPETTGTTVPPLTIFKGPDNALSTGGTVFLGTKGPAAPEYIDQNAVEPSVAGDREVGFVVGNFFAALTTDNGATYKDGLVSPFDFDDDPDQAPGDFFTGDQSVVSVPRAGKPPLIAWLLMYGDEETVKDPAGSNSLRLVVFRGKKQLLSYRGTDPSISSCTYVWTPATFGLPDDRSFDFPNIASTGQYLYISAQLFNEKGKGKGSLIWRVATSELEDNCDAGVGAFWLDEKHQPATLVQGASSTMYAAAHAHNLTQGDRLEIYKVADSSALMVTDTVNVTDYRGDGDYDCPLDNGGKDPCGNPDLLKVGAALGDGKMAGFRSGSTVGWLWNAKQQGNQYPYPYIRVATFDTGSLTLQHEASIYTTSTAITYPAVGVADDGSVGVTAYLMGGATLPTAVGWVVKDPRNGWPPGEMTTLRASTSAPQKSGFGDYFAVRQYDNCPNTFLGTTMTFSGGSPTPDVSTVWFGADRKAGCPDLVIDDFEEAQTGEPSGLLIRGAAATATITTHNTGGGTADPSRSAVYLSKDTVVDDTDLRPSQSTHLVPELAAGATDVGVTTFTVPRFMAPGEYYVIVCADDRTRVKEMSETDNCRAGAAPVNVLFTKAPLDSEVRDFGLDNVRSALVPGSIVTVSSKVVGHHLSATQLAGTRPVYTLSPSPEASPVEVPLRVSHRRQTLSGSGVTRARAVHDTLVLPKRLAPGAWYLRVCLRHPRGVGDAHIANDCRSLRHPFTVRRRSG